MAIDRKYLLRWLMREEGLVLGGAKPDSEGYLTMGYGHKCETFAERLLSKHLTQPDAVSLLESDIAKAIKGFRQLFADLEIDSGRSIALVALVFQLGVDGVRAFRRMRQAISAEAWEVAKLELLYRDPDGMPGIHSKYNIQTPERAERMAAILETGQLPQSET